MSDHRHDFRDWRHRLRDLHPSEEVDPPRSWVRNLHARVLRYFIARYDYQPLPESLLQESAKPSVTQPVLPPRTTIRVQRRTAESPSRSEEHCKKLLSDIQSGNIARGRHKD